MFTEKTLPARLSYLKDLQQLIIGHPQILEDLKRPLCLAAEEIFVNICSYGCEEDTSTVRFTMEVSSAVIILTFTDNGQPFNPLEDQADPDSYDLDTQIGGLGRLLAFSIMDEARYQYKDGQNVLTLTKHL